MIPRHLKERFDFLDNLRVETPPSPWELKSTLHVGGLSDIGFEPGTDLLLIVSTGGGRSVVDCTTGQQIARDESETYAFDTQELLVDSLPPMKSGSIRTGGLHGGGLAFGTNDGWGLDVNPTKWPATDVFLFADSQTLSWKPPEAVERVTKLASNLENIWVFGFSPTGQSFVIATSADLTFFSR